MTVAELRAELENLPAGAPVSVETADGQLRFVTVVGHIGAGHGHGSVILRTTTTGTPG